jgi:hypothetical protein
MDLSDCACLTLRISVITVHCSIGLRVRHAWIPAPIRYTLHQQILNDFHRMAGSTVPQYLKLKH